MIKECEKGNVDIVLVKTQARFARDTELLEKYIHNDFHQWGVRFITVIEGIDNTKQETKKTSQIIGLADQWYLEDTSLNIRKTLNSKRGDGQFTGSFTRYGMLKDPENKNHLIPDPATENVVRRIYDEYLNGYGLTKIANGLNKDKILSPLEYKKLNGVKLHNPFVKNLMNLEKNEFYNIKRNYKQKVKIYFDIRTGQIEINILVIIKNTYTYLYKYFW